MLRVPGGGEPPAPPFPMHPWPDLHASPSHAQPLCHICHPQVTALYFIVSGSLTNHPSGVCLGLDYIEKGIPQWLSTSLAQERVRIWRLSLVDAQDVLVSTAGRQARAAGSPAVRLHCQITALLERQRSEQAHTIHFEAPQARK